MESELSFEPRVYASSAPADAAVCSPYINALRRRLLAVWQDRDGERDATALDEQALRRLRQKRAFVLFLSPNALASSRVRLEMDAYRDLLAQDPPRLFLLARITPCVVPPELAGLPLLDVAEMGVESAAEEMARLVYGAPPRGVNAPPALNVSLDELGFRRESQGGVEFLRPPLCRVPEGEFLMGSDGSRDPWAWENEFPQHSVWVGAFEIGKYPVTVAEFACAVAAGAVDPPRSSWGMTWNTRLERPTHPVTYISWAAAQAYATWLARCTGEPWRLPTEPEWEKTARGVDARRFPWGDEWDATRANTSDGGPGDTTPVGAYGERGASPYGVQDMAGNVAQWCSTLASPYPYVADDGREDLTASGTRVYRGGAWGAPLRYWSLGPRNARAASRGLWLPNWVNGTAHSGFRLVRSA